MSYQVLSLKFRPQTFEEITGQRHVAQTLRNAIRLDRVGHGYLFTGPRGVGKTTAARILAKSLNCKNYHENNPCQECANCIEITAGNSMDVLEIDGASNRGINDIRDLREFVKYPPTSAAYKIYIIDEVHMLTKEAFNALLKTLEEPPAHVIFIMATTDPQKIPQTILSRTQRFDFKRLSNAEITGHLQFVLDRENITYDKSCLSLIATKADGSMRDSLSLLDQVIAYSGDKINLEVVHDILGVIKDDLYLKLIQDIITSNNQQLLINLSSLIDSGYSIPDFTAGFNSFLRGCLLTINDQEQFTELSEDSITWVKENTDFIQTIDVLRMMELTLQFESKLRYLQQPRIALESLFLKLAALDSTISITEVLSGKRKTAVHIEKTKKPVISKTEPSKYDVVQKKQLEISDQQVKSYNIEKPDQQSRTTPEKGQSGKSDEQEIDLNYIKNVWPKILEQFETINLSIANYLEDTIIKDFKEGQLLILIKNNGGFTLKSLNKNLLLIEKNIQEVIGTSIKIKFALEENSKIVTKKIKEREKEHPLMMDVIEIFKGELIR